MVSHILTILKSIMHLFKYYKTTSYATLNHILNYSTDCTTFRRNLHHLEPNQASPSYTIYCTTYWTSLNHIMHALYHWSLPAPLCRFFVQRYSATLKASGGHKSITFLVNRWFSYGENHRFTHKWLIFGHHCLKHILKHVERKQIMHHQTACTFFK